MVRSMFLKLMKQLLFHCACAAQLLPSVMVYFFYSLHIYINMRPHPVFNIREVNEVDILISKPKILKVEV